MLINLKSDVEHLENNSKYLFINKKAPNPCKAGNGVDNAFLNCRTLKDTTK